MNISGERILNVPIEKVWDGLFDPLVLQRCIPGGEEVTLIEESRYSVKMTTSLGPLKAKMKGTLQIHDATPPTSCTLTFEGNGGTIGFAKGSSSVTLSQTDDATLLQYDAETQINGKLAQLGSRLIDVVAKKLSAEFFNRFEAEMSAQPPETN